jgi:homogentisate solanesyltransferase
MGSGIGIGTLLLYSIIDKVLAKEEENRAEASLSRRCGVPQMADQPQGEGGLGTEFPVDGPISPKVKVESRGVEGEVNLEGVEGFKRFRLAFWKFLRPHTIRGTILGSFAVTLRAVLENPTAIDWALVPRAALGVLCLLCGNGYIVGINQIYDVQIDKINKPFLPIAAGELSKPVAWALCLVLAAAGCSLSTIFGPVITGLYTFGLFLGTIYSVPPFYLKRFPVAAFMIIATVRGLLLNFGVYYAARAAMRLPFVWSPTIMFATSFATWFATVIAVSKDLPDIEGDRANGVQSFAVRLGADRLSYIVAGMLLALYFAAAALPFLFPGTFRPWIMTPLHLVIAGLVARATLRLKGDNFSQPAIKAFYRFIWSIFYTNYFFLPFFAPFRR